MRDTELAGHTRDFRGIGNRGLDDRGLSSSLRKTYAQAVADPRPAPPQVTSPENTSKEAEGWFDAFAKEYTAETIGDADWIDAAKELDCEVPAIKAIAAVESGVLGAFWKAGWPIILYERHLFSSATGRQYDKENPDISGKTGYRWATKEEKKKAATNEMYGWTQDTNYSRLEKAYGLDKQAALKSASWGKFQILGKNHAAAGFASSVEDYVRAMCSSEREQLKAFVQFVKYDKVLHKALKEKNWAGFAEKYNGKEYKKFDYDTRMKTAYDAEKAASEKVSASKTSPPTN